MGPFGRVGNNPDRTLGCREDPPPDPSPVVHLGRNRLAGVHVRDPVQRGRTREHRGELPVKVSVRLPPLRGGVREKVWRMLYYYVTHRAYNRVGDVPFGGGKGALT